MLTVENISVVLGKKPVLDNVFLEVNEGEILSLLGPSGSGKTTLLRVIVGLEKPGAGRVMWNGSDLATMAPEKRRFGLMFQDQALFPHRSVAENIGFGLRMQGVASSDITKRVSDLLDIVRLPKFGERRVETLSGGEQQRVALARTLAPKPFLLLLDEPLGSLDRALRSDLVIDLQQIFSDLGTTAIVVTHDHEEGLTLGDRIGVIDSGHIQQVGSPRDLWFNPCSEFVARFLGFSTIVTADSNDAVISLPWGDVNRPAGWPSGKCRVVVPPYATAVTTNGDFGGLVEYRAFRGTHVALGAVTADGSHVTLLGPPPGPALGSSVRFSVDPHALVRLQPEEPSDEGSKTGPIG